ncbi:ArsR family transcriptional regulator [Corynebacterium sp. 320]|uniref:ATP-binding protein n=1 Tax=Corynebacterium TaxID=1716 RepID=UPI00125CA787|nr:MULTISPECIES: ATP-binding protein [Corynebacterium]KAB1503203.1 ArsR family transcriptional regulator [Corynebacterium sp. 320]KAB1550584.1 ArsR family transcriptional regulator [Corynebacterium sp. 321]KAB1550945.1 ArsR family transcriptional regulator [Corynebacterium sp. 319]KAB3527000.1 ArsR family transcriptional regulator [Corynebacterium sp. 250]KAB3538492.1 ArsR family transcriptional regulator [Corynebacterium sp. 366]
MRIPTVEQALSQPADEAVKVLASLPENQWFERKSGSIKPRDFATPLIAMANAEGGVVVAGISNGHVSPVSDKADNALRQVAADFTSPQVRCRIEELTTSNGRVLVFTVPPSDYVHENSRGECYQRIGDESIRLGFTQRQELEWDRGAASFDGRPVPDTMPQHLDLGAVEQFQQLLGSSSSQLVLQARDLLTSTGAVNVAGYLLFSSRPQAFFPQAHVRIMKYSENERGVGAHLNLIEGCDIRCEGPIPQQISTAATTIEELLPRRNALARSGKFEGMPIIPRDAWLEGVVNAVVHRSYSMSGDHIRVEIFPNRIEITSPGRFPGLADPTDPESISRYARNPRIARVCADLGITRELGEGIKRIYAEMRHTGLQEPIYQQTSEAIRLTLLAQHAVPQEITDSLTPAARKILDALRKVQKPLGTGPIVELVGLARPTVIRSLNDLREAGLVKWEGTSVRDPRATWELL